MLDEAAISRLIEPFGVRLDDRRLGQLAAYLELLLRWNEKINLTAVRGAAECVRRHFGESLCLGRWVELSGRLLDIGSGAGFPGLCLKIIFPGLAVTLLEPVAKKRAFLKEVARVCEMSRVEVRSERLEDFAGVSDRPVFEAATARGLGHLEKLIPLAGRCLGLRGELFLWLSGRQAEELGAGLGGVERVRLLTVGGGGYGEIWWGRKVEGGGCV